LKDRARAGKGPEVVRRLFGGPLLFAESAYGMTPQELLGPVQQDGFGAGLKAANEDRPLRLLFGKRAVLVYVEPSAQDPQNRHLFAAEAGQDRLGLGPCQLVRVGGKWVVWHTEIAPVR
jgi:hypothetical protein